MLWKELFPSIANEWDYKFSNWGEEELNPLVLDWWVGERVHDDCGT